MKILGAALLILGIVAVVMGGIGYNRERTIFKVGSMSASVTEHRTIPIAPIVGVLALAGGAMLLVMANRRRA